MPQPTYDLVVFGATSFVGQILARYLSGAGAGEMLRRIAGDGFGVKRFERLPG